MSSVVIVLAFEGMLGMDFWYSSSRLKPYSSFCSPSGAFFDVVILVRLKRLLIPEAGIGVFYCDCALIARSPMSAMIDAPKSAGVATLAICLMGFCESFVQSMLPFSLSSEDTFSVLNVLHLLLLLS